MTRELLVWPPGPADWRLRISVADIASDGPFSAYPGVERWMALLAGSGVELTIDDQRHRLLCGDAPLCFSGGSATLGKLVDGPVQDLNLMLRGISGTLTVAHAGREWAPPAGSAAGLFCAVRGRCTGIDVPGGALLWFARPPGALTLSPQVRATGPIGWWLCANIGGSPP